MQVGRDRYVGEYGVSLSLPKRLEKLASAHFDLPQ